ncbi:MAG TPA: GNAT family N-acetyltransferase [Kiloniellales bacterium]
MSRRRIVLAAAEGEHEMEIVRTLFREYADWLQVDLCFQDFAAELAGLPGAYAPPRGGLWLARVDGKVAGTIAFRPLEDRICEMKRLWVRDEFRGLGLGRRLVETCLRAARGAGYSAMCLDTLGHMTAARTLYESLGFREIPAYYTNPLDDVRYMRRELDTDPVAEDLPSGPS